MIQACLNGGRSTAECPAVPLTPEQLAAEAGAAVAAGAGALHVHVRNPQGRESIAPEDVGAVVAAVRKACPRAPIGISTGSWIEPDAAKRLRTVESWDSLPDYASVNLGEEGAVPLVKLLLTRGIGVEAGVWNGAHAELLAASGFAARCLRVLMEPFEKNLPEVLANVREMEEVLDRAGIRISRLLHGYEVTAWGVLEEALRRGYDTRIGLEDVLALPDGAPASSNGPLVAAAARIAARVVAHPRPPSDKAAR